MATKPHLVFFPFPAQGHVTPALQLARLLHHCHGFDVTFVHNEHNRRRLLRARGPDALAGSPGFRFVALPDGLPASDEDAVQDMDSLLLCLPTMVPHFKKLVQSELPTSTATCRLILISDLEPILRAAQEIGLPCVTLWTGGSASSFMAFQQFQQLVAKGLVPLKDAEQLKNGYLDSTVVDWVPGMPTMRLKDFPSFIRTTDPDDALIALTVSSMECHRTVPSAVIIHTFHELESQVIGAMAAILPPIYAIGPLPLLLTQDTGCRGGPVAVDTSGSSLSKQNRACLDWLDGRRANSVVLASFGSIVKLTNEQLVELAWGLANSGYDFLWVIRSDQAAVLPPEFLAETEGRGCVTSWCPQEAVLRHEAVGAFLTHCGWNSMMESLCAGVPMLCWPFAADQPTNSRLACTEWRLGVEMGEDPKREEMELAIRQVMGGERGEELRRSATEWKKKAALATRPGGSSWVNLERVVNDVLLLL